MEGSKSPTGMLKIRTAIRCFSLNVWKNGPKSFGKIRRHQRTVKGSSPPTGVFFLFLFSICSGNVLLIEVKNFQRIVTLKTV